MHISASTVLPLITLLLYATPGSGYQLDWSAQVDQLLSEAQNYQHNFEVKSDFIEKANQLARQSGDDDTVFRVAVERMVIATKEGHLEQAERLFELAMRLERIHSERATAARLYTYKGLLEMRKGNQGKAIEGLTYAEALAEGLPKQLGVIHYYLGRCFLALGDFEEASTQLKKSMEYLERADYGYFLRDVKFNLGSLLLQEGKISEAEKLFESLVANTPGERGYLGVQTGMAAVEIKKGNFALAKDICEKALETATVHNQDDYCRMLHEKIAQALLGEKDFSAAEKSARHALDFVGTELASQQKKFGALLVLGIALANQPDKREQGLVVLEECAGQATERYIRLRAFDELVSQYKTHENYAEAFRILNEANKFNEENLKRRMQVVEYRFRPRMELNRLTMIANKEKSNAAAARALADKAKLLAESSMLESAGNRRVRNLAILAAAAVALTSLFYFRSESRRSQTQTQLIESEKRSQLERQLSQKKRIELVGQLTGNVAHDFNNILQVITHSNFLMEESLAGKLDEGQQKLLRSANEAVDLGARITKQLLTFSGKQETNPKRTSACDLLENTEILFSSVGGDELDIQVTFDPSLGNDLQVIVDRSELLNALLNLLLNSRRAMSGKGTIEIRLSEFHGAPLIEGNQVAGQYLKIDIVDEGCGMSQNTIDHAIEPYFTSKTDVDGSGLGLSSVNGFVQQLNGHLQICSVESKGTTVSLFIPAAHGPAKVCSRLSGRKLPTSQSLANQSPNTHSLANVRCLIVEDNPRVLQSLTNFMSNRQINFETCNTADQAKQLLERDRDFQIVVSDVRMPGQWNGVDLARWIVGRFDHLSMILISGNEAHVKLKNCVFLRKPFQFAELQHALERSLTTAQADFS